MHPANIIIAGTNKAGTTSLFNYLSDHTEISPSKLKQTLFFIDEAYKGLTSKPLEKYDGKTETYDQFFSSDSSSIKYRLEATPDYLYSQGTAEKILDFSKQRDIKLIFILRDPVDRFKSWYRHAKRADLIEDSLSYSDFIDKALNEEMGLPRNVLETGNYSNYLKLYTELFPKHAIQTIFFEDLISHPESTMEKLSIFLKIDDEIFKNYQYENFNKASEVRSRIIWKVYASARIIFLKTTHRFPRLNKYLSPLKLLFSSAYKKLNNKKSSRIADNNDIDMLTNYYKKEFNTLEKELGCNIPWDRYEQ